MKATSPFYWALSILMVGTMFLAGSPDLVHGLNNHPDTIVSQSLKRILNAARSHQHDTQTRLSQVQSVVHSEVKRRFTFEIMTRRILGPYVRQISDREFQQIQQLLGELVAKLYTRQLRALVKSYPPGKSSYGFSLQEVKHRSNRAMVSANLKLRRPDQQTTVELTFKLIKKGSWQIYDVTFQRISLLNFYRSKLRSFYANESTEKLIRRLKRMAN